MIMFDRKLLNTFQSLLPVHIFICYCFVISGLIVNFAQLLTWILIWPFSKQLYRKINYFLGTLLWSRKFRKIKFLIKIKFFW
jgi:lysophosphatidic acid acyltransferase/lysophosphatidylinositol acyltransferase